MISTVNPKNVPGCCDLENKKSKVSFVMIFHSLAPSSFGRWGSCNYRKGLVSKESVTPRHIVAHENLMSIEFRRIKLFLLTVVT